VRINSQLQNKNNDENNISIHIVKSSSKRIYKDDIDELKTG